LREVLLPAELKVVGRNFLRGSSVELVDLSRTGAEGLEASFYRGWPELREVLLPLTLTVVGARFPDRSAVERIDLSGTAVESLGDSFCLGCKKLREVLLPRTLVWLDSVASPIAPLMLLVLPVPSGMGIGRVSSASVLSGLVGLGSVPARPLWPAK
jgi:hypothetical protein